MTDLQTSLERFDAGAGQTRLSDFSDDSCRLCDLDLADLSPVRAGIHYVVEHPDFVAARVEALAAEIEPDYTRDENGHHDGAVLEPTGPASFGDVDADPPGQRLGGRADRECNDCGRAMSKPYARTFAQPDGTLYCPDCRSRTQRYSMDPVIDPSGDQRQPFG